MAWKYIWNPSGYPEETVEISTEGLSINSKIELPHTYFDGNTVSVYIKGLSTPLVVSPDANVPSLDILLDGYVSKLSQESQKPVYRLITLKSLRVLNTKLLVKCVFLGDIISPDYFNQDLHQNADVIHKSIKTDFAKFNTVECDSIKVNEIKNNFGIISDSKIELNSPVTINSKAVINNVNIKNDSIEFNSNFFTISNSKAYLKYDDSTGQWKIFDERNKEIGTICYIIDSKYNNSIQKDGLAYINRNNPNAIEILPFVKVRKNELEVDTISVNKIKIKNYLVEYNEETASLNINNMVFISADQIQIGPLIVDKNFLANTIEMQSKIIMFEKYIFDLLKRISELENFIKSINKDKEKK